MKTIKINNTEISLSDEDWLKLRAEIDAMGKEEKTLPKKWEDLEVIKGHYIDTYSKVSKKDVHANDSSNYNIYYTEAQAKSSIAMAQLSQVMAEYNGDWVADWEKNEWKYCIKNIANELEIDTLFEIKYFLAFKTKELAEEFLKNFKDLIEVYYGY